MIAETLTSLDFFGCIFALPILIYLNFIIFEGLGWAFRDVFFISKNKKY